MLIRQSLAILALTAATLIGHTQPDPSPEPIEPVVMSGTIALPIDADVADTEVWFTSRGNTELRNVSRPTLTPFLPTGQPNGAAMIVAPGGGFLGLAIEKEGWAVARYLADHGIAAFVLKYRVLPTPASQTEFRDKMLRMLKGEKVGFAPPENTPEQSLADGLAALRHVRSRATDYGIDPHRVGFMGFSAGGFLTISTVVAGGDDRPDFAAPIYPRMGAIDVPADAPPMFVLIASDDFLLRGIDGFPLIDSYRAAGKPIRFQLLESGGHGFGPGVAGTPTENWMDGLYQWMQVSGFLNNRT